MKKYKLIKRYPGIPENWKLGTIVVKESNSDYINITEDNKEASTICLITKSHVEEYPEFWEKVESLPIGTKIVDTYNKSHPIYEKIDEDKWRVFKIKEIQEDLIGYYNTRYEIIKENYRITKILCDSISKHIININYNLKPSSTFEEFRNIQNLEPNTKIYQIERVSDKRRFTIDDNIFYKQDNDTTLIGPMSLIGFEFEIAPIDKNKGTLSFIHTNKILGNYLDIENIYTIEDLIKTEDNVYIKKDDNSTLLHVVDKDNLFLYEATYYSVKELRNTHNINNFILFWDKLNALDYIYINNKLTQSLT